MHLASSPLKEGVNILGLQRWVGVGPNSKIEGGPELKGGGLKNFRRDIRSDPQRRIEN